MKILIGAFLVFGLLILSASVVDGLKCYRCLTDCNKGVGGLGKVDCNDGACTKISDNNKVVTRRDCSLSQTLTPGCTATNLIETCVCKDKDLCNGSSHVRSVSLNVFLFLAVIFLILRVI